MSGPRTDPQFTIISGTTVRRIMAENRYAVRDAVKQAYLLHRSGQTVNPDSYFLRFPQTPDARIIALPAYIGEDYDVAGIKWIASFPGNIAHNLPRASAVLVLNDPKTGYPFSIMEASAISAVRTAASAELAARLLKGDVASGSCLGVIGTGVIARSVVSQLCQMGWRFDRACLFDNEPRYAQAAADLWSGIGIANAVTVVSRADEVLRSSDVIVLTTTSAAPWICDASVFAHHPIVLHISLRDIAPDLILAANNVVDDVQHCSKASTSIQLAADLTGNHAFIAGTIGDMIAGAVDVDLQSTRILSPFGLGVLDLAVGKVIHDIALAENDAAIVPGFFSELERW